ncbi:transposase [Streptomyces sp. NPDC056817]|uniref:transposase n=1 Tax=Streptomyces sp. NPDC056817 TaxID=3345950 RepID=UPI0036A72EA1
MSGRFARSETRETFARMTRGMLMELEDVNCWSLAEAIGERRPHRLHHLLSRAVWDEDAVLERTAAWAVDLLDDGDGILIADETGDAKSSTDAVATARQVSSRRSSSPARWRTISRRRRRSATSTKARSPAGTPGTAGA